MEQTQEQQTLFTENYSERAFVVCGDSKPYRISLKNLGGSFNKNLKPDRYSI